MNFMSLYYETIWNINILCKSYHTTNWDFFLKYGENVKRNSDQLQLNLHNNNNNNY